MALNIHSSQYPNEVFHLGISLAVADHSQLVAEFNKGLGSMCKDGRLAEILSQYSQHDTVQLPIEKKPIIKISPENRP